MKNNKPSKSFSFKVAKSTEIKNKPAKAREGVAIAGCSLGRDHWGGVDYRYRLGTTDGGEYC